jgi:hypothetical protein
MTKPKRKTVVVPPALSGELAAFIEDHFVCPQDMDPAVVKEVVSVLFCGCGSDGTVLTYKVEAD